MRYLPLAVLPVGLYYWRKNYPNRHHKVNDSEYVSFDEPFQVHQIVDFDEVILSDPNWCSGCWEEMPWPPVGKCRHCGDTTQQKNSIDEIKKEIAGWTGADDVHI
jgi:hypothetical protein